MCLVNGKGAGNVVITLIYDNDCTILFNVMDFHFLPVERRIYTI
jgi:hypothetical protein